MEETFSGLRVSLLGYGRSARACLARLLPGARVTVRDRDPAAIPPSDADALRARGVAFSLGDGWLSGLRDADVILRSPAVRPDLPEIADACAHGARLSSEWEWFSSETPATLLGVTGSDGKTTTATLAAALLRADARVGRAVLLGGNIGVPLLSSLDETKAGDVAVAELSSFQLMTPGRACARAVITNVRENHLNWHTGMAEYIAAKRAILSRDTAAVLNAACPVTRQVAEERQRPGDVIFSCDERERDLRAVFPRARLVTLQNGAIACDGAEILPLRAIRVPGKHNIENFMAAVGLVLPYLSDPRKTAARVARDFTGVPHRLQTVAVVRGVTYIDSSIDSTPSRTAAAVLAVSGRPVVLLGGAGKGVSFAPLREALAGRCTAAILFGATRDEIADALAGCPFPVEKAEDLRDAVKIAATYAPEGGTVLLSPACTSFDAFRDYAARGDAFRAYAREIEKQGENT